jgi:hypothetical protein
MEMIIISIIFKSYDLKAIRLKLAAIYVLNVTDIVFTLYLLSTGIFIEVNSIMNSVIGNDMTFSVKVILPAVLIAYIAIRLSKASDKQLHRANLIVNICLIFYSVINVFHMIWSSYSIYWSLLNT